METGFGYFFLLLLGIIFFGLTVITGLILGIVGLSTDKKKLRNGGFITLGAGLILLVLAIAFMVNRTVETVKDTFSGISQSLDSTITSASETGFNDIFEDERNYLAGDSTSNVQMKKIRSYIPDDVEAGIDPSFFTYFGNQSSFRFPLVYPYSIHCMDVKDFGTLVDESKVTDVKNGGGSEENILFGVTHFNYDGKMLLLQTTNKLSDGDTKEKISYFIYDYATKKLTEFNSETELYKKAGKLGYEGNKELMSITDYDYLF
jgi:hypothetical protein